MPQLTIQQALEMAMRHHQAGQLQQAEQIYRQILAQQPEHAEATHYVGVLANQGGRNDIAVDLIRRAIVLRPNYAEAHCNLGNILRDLGQLDEAIAAYRQAIALQPNAPEALNNLGNALQDKGELEEAIAALRQAIALRPNLPEAHYNLGNALRENGRLDEAITVYRQAIALRPTYAEAHNDLGIALKAKGRHDEAIAAHRQAIALSPGYAMAHNNLGNALLNKGQFQEAIAAYRQAIALNPKFPGAHNNLGNALKDTGQLDEAIAAYRHAVALNPNLSEAHNNLGNVLKARGQLDEAIAAFRQAIALRPDYIDAHSNLVFTLHYHPGYDASAIADELRRWNSKHAEPVRKFIQKHVNDPNPDRRLRIGYVSPDFRSHPVGRNLIPWFHLHDHREFHITGYAQVPLPDATTRQLQQHADAWHSIVGLSDEEVAEQIRQDRIDILVDLALHTGDHRLLVFARKPAPVQVSYLGYCGSTGLQTIDYRISDPYLDPPGEDESCYTEKTIRLPRTYWCYQPGADSYLAPAPSPVLIRGFITFGCQNNYCKISNDTWNTWAAILRSKPNSRLIVYCEQGSHRDAARKILASAGVNPDRLLFSESRGTDYFLRYHQIDIALDPFPFGGGTTTCDALWMGVPVVTLSGKTAVGRGGRSILSNLGLPELIAYTLDQYVQIAINLSNDLNRMDSLRRNMRARMSASPLMDAEQYARDMEAAYRQMWRTWCQTSSARS